MSGVKLTKAQREAMLFLHDYGDDPIVLWEYLINGHRLVTLHSLSSQRDEPLVSWSSNTSMATCVMPSEYEHIRDTTSYVALTEAGRAALTRSQP